MKKILEVVEIKGNMQIHLHTLPKEMGISPHTIIAEIQKSLGLATHEEVEAEYLLCVKAKEAQIKELQMQYTDLLNNYNLREQVLDDVQAQADRNLKWAIEAKTELQKQEMKLGELFEQFLILKQKEVLGIASKPGNKIIGDLVGEREGS